MKSNTKLKFEWGRGAAPLMHLFEVGTMMPMSACGRGYCGDAGVSFKSKGKKCSFCLKIESQSA